MFSAEDSKAKAALEWLQNQSGQATADVLLAQNAAWEKLLAGDGARSRSVALAKSHGISVPRSCQNALRDGRDYHIVRDHFLNASNQETGRARAFASFLLPVAAATVPDGGPESTLTIHEVTDFPFLVRFAQMKK